MLIAMQDTLMRRADVAARFDRAAELGLAGLELATADLDANLEATAQAARRTGVRVAGLHFGHAGALLATDRPTREAALVHLRAAIGAAVDLDAAGVLAVPHYGPYTLPDMFPWKSPGELYAEMLHMHLRTLSDFCHALGTTLYIQTAHPDETAFISRAEQANAVAARVKHPHVKIALDLPALLAEADDPAGLVTAHLRYLGYLRTPIGLIDRAPLSALRAAGFEGWLAISGQANSDAEVEAALSAARAQAEG